MIRIVSALALICSFHSVSGRLSYAATLNVDKMGEYIAPTVFMPVFVRPGLFFEKMDTELGYFSAV